ncbi:MAG: NUDIX hydrolase [Planctomycetaceae bacterium]
MTNDIHVLGEGRFLRLVVSDGWEYAERRNVTGIVTIAAAIDGRVILVEQYRPPLRANVIELPAGLAGDGPDNADEALELAAQRELEEETGYRATKLERLFSGPLSAGMTTEVVTFFRATGLERVGEGGGDGSETIIVHRVSLGDAERWLAEQSAAGKLVDPKVYVGLYVLARFR